MNNTSIYTADRMTHLKIVAVSLICAIAVSGIGIAARVNGPTDGTRLEKAMHSLHAAKELEMEPAA